MSSKAKAKGNPKATGVNPWIIAGAFAIGLLLVAWSAFGNKGSDTTIIITSNTQANELAKQAADLSLQHMKDLDAGIELTEPDKADIRKAAVIFDALADYKPRDIRPYVGAGKIYQALGNDDAAIRRLTQGLDNPEFKDQTVIADTLIEAHYLLSVSLFNKHRYDEALTQIDEAIKSFGRISPIYLSQRASIYIQLKPPKYKEAVQDLMSGLSVDPEHKRSLSLLKLIGISATQAYLDAAKQSWTSMDYEAAVTYCTAGMKALGDIPALLALRSDSYIKLGQKELARKDLKTLMSVDPTNADIEVIQKNLK